jgi:dCTP deaminase
MSLITYSGILELLKDGVVENFDPNCINGASLDVRLGNTILVEDTRGKIVDLATKETLPMRPIQLNKDDVFDLLPGQFILAGTEEIFHLPNNVAAEFRLKSSSARSALDQALAVWCDPGWHGSALTMEIKNNSQYSILRLRSGMKIGQMIFWKGEPVPDHANYANCGQYNHDKQAQPSRGIK